MRFLDQNFSKGYYHRRQFVEGHQPNPTRCCFQLRLGISR